MRYCTHIKMYVLKSGCAREIRTMLMGNSIVSKFQQHLQQSVTVEHTLQYLPRLSQHHASLCKAPPPKPTRRLPCKISSHRGFVLHSESLAKILVPLAYTPLQCFTAQGRAPQASEAAATTSNSGMRG